MLSNMLTKYFSNDCKLLLLLSAIICLPLYNFRNLLMNTINSFPPFLISLVKRPRSSIETFDDEF